MARRVGDRCSFVVHRRRVLAGSALALSTAAHGQEGGDGTTLVGEWGAIDGNGARRLRVRLVIEEGADGLAARVDFLGADRPSLEGADIKATDDAIAASFPTVGAAVDLRLTEDGRLAGTLRQGASRDIVFHRDPDWESLSRPPALSADYLALLRSQAGSPALAAAARRRGGTLVAAVDGARQAGEDSRATIEDKWHLGSITKSMTATLTAMLVEDGALAWETTVGEVLGDRIPEMRDDYRDVSLLHLLSHRSGLQPDLRVLRILRFPLEEDDPRESRIAWAAEALALEPVGPKGETYRYANNGYVVVGAMLEARLGVPWENLMADRLFTPLRLASAGFGPPGSAGALDEPVGHSLGPLGVLGLSARRTPHPPGGRADNPAALGPAGRVHMSLPDVLTYLEAHRDGARLLSAQSWERLHAPPFGGDYALGLLTLPDGLLWHNGSNTMWCAEMMIDPTRGRVAVAAANDGAIARAAPIVGDALLSAAETAGSS